MLLFQCPLHLQAPLKSQTDLVKCAPDTPVLPGCEDPKLLSKLSKLQRILIKKVAEEYGYLCLYSM